MQNKKIVYIDLDGVIVDLIGEMHHELKNTTQTFEEPTDLIDHSETIFLNSKPIPHAWVEKHLPTMFKRLILTHHKNQLIGDYLIDDRINNGAGDFKGEHIHIFQERFPTWQSVLDYLLTSK